MKKQNNKGLSMVEVIIVVAIMAILVAILVPNFIGYIDKARKVRDLEMARVLGEALERVIILDPAACRQWENIDTKKPPVYFNVNDPTTGKQYKVVNAFEWTLSTADKISNSNYKKNAQYGYLRDPYSNDKRGTVTSGMKDLYNAYVDELAQFNINIFYRKYQIGQYRILKNAENGRVEVWVCPINPGSDGEGKTNGWVYYRLYPDADPRYMQDIAPVGRNASGPGYTTAADKTFPK